ncbi:family 35 putative beta-galactosidase glycoside hydrolase [Leptodontidium sp. 2 PMI_412]|nr:family 35 putative beta-galactosidase glycoside hydrolase [Leptodontidium sp. 2 PMI_412]
MANPLSIPLLRKTGPTWELIVDGKPWLLRGAELHNSSLSSSRYMDTAWQNLSDMGINTVLGSVTWKCIEPVEGQFDFTELDVILKGAESHGLRLILLWFGSFKNGQSSYTPSWVIRDMDRFPHMLHRKEGKLEVTGTLSILAGDGVAADARAFKTLMSHLQKIDTKQTVIMVQVENEVGCLGDSRDRSPLADRLFNSAVPEDLIEFLSSEWDSLHPKFKAIFSSLPSVLQRLKGSPNDSSKDRSWKGVFGESNRADELFMAYHYALYLEQVAAAGREVYPLPLYANAWIPMPAAEGESSTAGPASGGGQPGEYPSGGPTPSVLDIWMRYAPTIDFLSPDIYAGDYEDTCAAYCHKGNLLFIPEQRRDEYGARRMWPAIGTHGAIGVSPFGIDSLTAQESAFTKHYKLLASVSTTISKARLRPESMVGFCMDDFESELADKPITKRFKEFEVTITRAFVFGKPGPGFGIIIELEPSRFLFIGMGFKAAFKSTSPKSVYTGISNATEKRVSDVEKGLLETERYLGGDETSHDRWINMPNEDPDYGGAPVPVLIPARTMITEATVYSLEPTQDLEKS